MRWTAMTSILVGFGLAAWGAVTHISSANPKLPRPHAQSTWRASLTPALGQDGVVDHSAQPSYLFSRTTTFSMADGSDDVVKPRGQRVAPASDPFEQVVRKAQLSPDKLAKAFGHKKPAATQVALAEPAAERFGAASSAVAKHLPHMALAYAAPGETRAAQALHTLADEEDRSNNDLASLPETTETPDSAPIPGVRPSDPQSKPRTAALKDAAEDEQPEDAISVVPPRLRPKAEADEAAAEPEEVAKPKRQIAVASRQNEPGAEKLNGGLGWSFRNIFGSTGSNGARAGKGVAVYDISAAKVYMPDGTVLAANSGIGKMADNPKYANVRMNGPTPPHTYNLKMRETRFHGVEAIRMLPVDGKNKYGRTGILAHTQLLRGRPGQSHGCVAFKDYDKFLTAFKKGKVKQMVVVSSGGRAAATRLAVN